MKLLLAILSFSMILFMGCSKETPTNPGVNKSTLTATISGNTNIKFASTSYISLTTIDNLSFAGLTLNYTIALEALLYGVGTYKLEADGFSPKVSVADRIESEFYDSNSGEIIVTTCDSSAVKGTFHCTAVSTKDSTKKINVTNGTFEYYFKKQ